MCESFNFEWCTAGAAQSVLVITELFSSQCDIEKLYNVNILHTVIISLHPWHYVFFRVNNTLMSKQAQNNNPYAAATRKSKLSYMLFSHNWEIKCSLWVSNHKTISIFMASLEMYLFQTAWITTKLHSERRFSKRRIFCRPIPVSHDEASSVSLLENSTATSLTISPVLDHLYSDDRSKNRPGMMSLSVKHLCYFIAFSPFEKGYLNS